MSEPVSLEEAKLFLRVTHDAEDGLVSMFLEAAKARVEAAVGMTLDEASPAPLRLCLLYLAAQAYERGEAVFDEAAVAAWLAPYREVRL